MKLLNWVIILVIIIIYVFYHFKQEKVTNEKFSGSYSDNGFTNLTCLTGSDGKNYVFKIDSSLNLKSPNGQYHKTLQTLLHPTTKLPIQISDFVNPSDTVPCNDSSFSTYYTKNLRDPNSQASKLLKLINGENNTLTMNETSSWQIQECNKGNINQPGHWCNTVYNTISNPVLCKNAPGKITPKFCNNLNALNTYTKSNDSTSKDIINYLGQYTKALPCNQMCQRSSGQIPQQYTDKNGKLVCLKDTGIVNGQCTGTPLFNLVNDKIVDSWSRNCKRCASRASTDDEKQALTNSGYAFTECMKGCPYTISKSTLD